MTVVDSEGFRSQSELFAGKSNGQWKEFSTSLLCTSMAVGGTRYVMCERSNIVDVFA